MKAAEKPSVAILTEQAIGQRFCKTCNKLLPLDQFNPNQRAYKCLTHLRAEKRFHVLGTHEKRAFNSLRCRARDDRLIFGQAKLIISRKQVTAMLTPEQMANYSRYCLIPRRPDLPLTADNSVIVTGIQRSFVVSNWKLTKDSDQYERDLLYIIGAPAVATP